MSHQEIFLLGVLTAMFCTAALFFLRFWKETRDPFFLTFAASFLVEGLSRMALLLVEHPNRPPAGVYIIRMLASLLIIGAILQKNFGRNR